MSQIIPMRQITFMLLFISLLFSVISCSRSAPVDPKTDKGIGPVKEVSLGPVDEGLAAKGKAIFQIKCSNCHKMDKRYVGPPLRNITHITTPEFIMNMILNPQEMTQKDPVAHDLLAQYNTQMSVSGLSQDDARAILEFLRVAAEGKEEQLENKKLSDH